MHNIKLKDVKNELVELFKIQSPSKKEDAMQIYLLDKLCELGINAWMDKKGNILGVKGDVADGEFVPCMVAHMDTVFEFEENIFINFEYEKKLDDYKIYATTKSKGKDYFTGCGFDDKNGIWIALKMLEKYPKIKVVFTVEEETGGAGAEAVNMEFFSNVGYCIQCDRRGNSDLVTSIMGDICSQEFLDVITPEMQQFGYKEVMGMFTDVEVFSSKNIGVSCVNMSCGYHNPHTDKEYTMFSQLINTLNFVDALIEKLGEKQYPHDTFVESTRKGRYYNHYGSWDDDFDWEFEAYNAIPNSGSCMCSNSLIDASCQIHNPRVSNMSGVMCQCGEELSSHRDSLNCDYCGKVYLYI